MVRDALTKNENRNFWMQEKRYSHHHFWRRWNFWPYRFYRNGYWISFQYRKWIFFIDFFNWKISIIFASKIRIFSKIFLFKKAKRFFFIAFCRLPLIICFGHWLPQIKHPDRKIFKVMIFFKCCFNYRPNTVSYFFFRYGKLLKLFR